MIVLLALPFHGFSKSVNFVYLFVYRTYIALKKIVVDRVLRRWPWAQRRFDSAKFSIKRHILPSRQVWVQVQSGFARGMWMRLRIPEEAGFWRGEHEPDVQQALSAMVRPGDVVYDVGAHVGSIALGAARLVGATGRVMAFEGDPANILRLRENSSRNNLELVLRVVHAAVWSSTADAEIRFRRGSAGTTGGVEAGGQHPVLADGEWIRVPAITLDGFIASGGLVPQFVKIDVEGGECEVLLGGASLFTRQRPALIVEVHHQQADQQIRAWLEQFRYSSKWRIPAEGFPRCLTAWPAERDPRAGVLPDAVP
jgi:FkbM family methyltransferase